MRTAAPPNYRATSRFAGSTMMRAASRGRCAAPPHERPVTCTGRAARWARRATGRHRLCRPVRCGLRASSVRGCNVAGLRHAVGTSAGLHTGHGVVGQLARRRHEGGQDGDWRLRVAAVPCYEAANRFTNLVRHARLRRGRSPSSSAHAPAYKTQGRAIDTFSSASRP